MNSRPSLARYESAQPQRVVLGRVTAAGSADALIVARQDVLDSLAATDAGFKALDTAVTKFFTSHYPIDMDPTVVDTLSADQQAKVAQDAKWYMTFSKGVGDWVRYSHGFQTQAWWDLNYGTDMAKAKKDADAWQLSLITWRNLAMADYGIVAAAPSVKPSESSMLFWMLGGLAVLGTAGFVGYKVLKKKEDTSPRLTPEEKKQKFFESKKKKNFEDDYYRGQRERPGVDYDIEEDSGVRERKLDKDKLLAGREVGSDRKLDREKLLAGRERF